MWRGDAGAGSCRMTTPYFMMSTTHAGSIAFVDRWNLEQFAVETSAALGALLELMTSCNDQYLLQQSTLHAHNLAHQLKIASAVLVNGIGEEWDPDWEKLKPPPAPTE
jgi:hypothetical protein